MSMGKSKESVHSSPPARWDDLEAFGAIAEGLRSGKTLQRIAEDPLTGISGARMLYFRLGRLERVLGHRLVDRRPWGRDAHLTEAGEKLSQFVSKLLVVRRQLHESFRKADVPVLKVATHSTLMSTLLPAAMEKNQRGSHVTPGFHVELVLVGTYAEALAAVNEGRVDIGVYLVLPNFDDISVPRNVRREILGRSDTLVIFPPSHRFAARTGQNSRAVVHLEELVDECVIIRGYVDRNLLPMKTGGRRIIVTHTLDKLTYVRLGIGVSLYPQLAYDLLSPPSGVNTLPLHPPLCANLTLLQPRKRTRPLHQTARQFLTDLRAFCVDLSRKEKSGQKGKGSKRKKTPVRELSGIG